MEEENKGLWRAKTIVKRGNVKNECGNQRQRREYKRMGQ